MSPADDQEFTRSYWAENWSRTWRDWEDRQALVGFALLVLALLGYGWIAQDKTMALIGIYVAGAYLVIRILIITPWAMWKDSTKAIGEFRDRLRPRFSFVFDPDNIPYLQHFRLTDGQTVRMYRVGIRNDSAAMVRHVRVVIESVAFMLDGAACLPSTDHPVPVEHALNVMGIDRKDGMVNLAPAGDKPTAYIDFAEQRSSDGRNHRAFSLCYATTFRAWIPLDPGPWRITLRVEGGDTFARQSFLISRDEQERMVVSPHRLG